MKKLIIFLSLFLCFSSTSTLFAKAKSKMYIAVQNAQLKDANKKSAKTIFFLPYASEVTIEKETKKWSYVYSTYDETIKGWIPTSALSARKLLKNSRVSADAKELALAGKGFNKAIEEEFMNHSSINFSELDNLEKIIITEDEINTFIEEGQLK